MARKVVNRKELRAQNDAAEAREKTKKAPKKSPQDKAAKTPKPKKEKVAKDPKAPKKPSRKKAAKESRMKAFWGVYNQGMKRLAMFEYSDKKAADLMASSRTNHFIQLVKEPITE